MKLVLSRKLRRIVGFTLIEGMLMFTALGIAASLTFTRYLSFGSSAQVSARATQITNINALLEGFAQNGGTFDTTGSQGTTTTNGVLPNDTVANVITALQAGVYAGGILYELPPGTINWNGTAPTDTYYAAHLRLQ